MSIARLNLSHASHAFAVKVIQAIRQAEEELHLPTNIGIWVDVNGPKIRSGRLVPECEGGVELYKGDVFTFLADPTILGDNTKVHANYPKEFIQVGDRVFIDDGLLSFTVTHHNGEQLQTTVDNSGVLGENKGVSFPTRIVDKMPTISAKDRNDILFALDQNVDFVSVSCIRGIADVEEMRILLGNSKIKVGAPDGCGVDGGTGRHRRLTSHLNIHTHMHACTHAHMHTCTHTPSLQLVAKIENRSGLDNFAGILKMADVVVIDRGYLGAEVESEVIAIAQKKMIALANTAGKPVLVANQMLESMRTHPRPTRSESAGMCDCVCLRACVGAWKCTCTGAPISTLTHTSTHTRTHARRRGQCRH